MWWSNTRTSIKLCEFETVKEVMGTRELDIEAIGFHHFIHHNFNERLERFAQLLPLVPSNIRKVLLSDLPCEQLITFCERLPVDAVQLYPDWEPKDILQLRSKLPTIKILKVMSAQADENFTRDNSKFLARYVGTVDGILLDSFRRGGTGKAADWDDCRRIVEASPIPVFLAGGLTPENVGEAMRRVRPFGVDVETGVSDRMPSGQLVKNHEKCRKFVEAVRLADDALSRSRERMRSAK